MRLCKIDSGVPLFRRGGRDRGPVSNAAGELDAVEELEFPQLTCLPGRNFCPSCHEIEFPLYEKSAVTRLSGNALFAELDKATGHAPQWNFHKYVIDRDGKPVASFASAVTPDWREITLLIEKLLGQKPAPARG